MERPFSQESHDVLLSKTRGKKNTIINISVYTPHRRSSTEPVFERPAGKR